MTISDSAAHKLAQLLGSGTDGELIPELVRHGLQALIETEAAAALGADRHWLVEPVADPAMTPAAASAGSPTPSCLNGDGTWMLIS